MEKNGKNRKKWKNGKKGMQSYVVKKERMKKISMLYEKSVYVKGMKSDIWKEELKKMLKSKGEVKVEIAIDYILNRVLRSVIVSPMVVIESSDTRSLLGHDNERDYWSVYFKGVEYRRSEYE